MALPPTDDKTDEAFLREVDEGLRADQLVTMWRNWGRWAIGVIVLGLVVFAGVLYYNSHSEAAAGKQGEEFDAALTDVGANKISQADPTLKQLAESGKPGYSAMARFTQADILLDKKDIKGAVAKFAEIANDTSIDKPFRDLALIRQTSTEYDAMKPDAVVARLKPLAVPDSPWFGSAGEMLAATYVKQGKRAEAGKLYGQMAKAETVPPSLQQRAVQMAGLLGVDAVQDQTGEKNAQ